ncbi:MAG: hypothetical protein AAGI14_03795 [Pseudomonadota bacterium]
MIGHVLRSLLSLVVLYAVSIHGYANAQSPDGSTGTPTQAPRIQETAAWDVAENLVDAGSVLADINYELNKKALLSYAEVRPKYVSRGFTAIDYGMKLYEFSDSVRVQDYERATQVAVTTALDILVDVFIIPGLVAACAGLSLGSALLLCSVGAAAISVAAGEVTERLGEIAGSYLYNNMIVSDTRPYRRRERPVGGGQQVSSGGGDINVSVNSVTTIADGGDATTLIGGITGKRGTGDVNVHVRGSVVNQSGVLEIGAAGTLRNDRKCITIDRDLCVYHRYIRRKKDPCWPGYTPRQGRWCYLYADRDHRITGR